MLQPRGGQPSGAQEGRRTKLVCAVSAPFPEEALVRLRPDARVAVPGLRALWVPARQVARAVPPRAGGIQGAGRHWGGGCHQPLLARGHSLQPGRPRADPLQAGCGLAD